MMSPRQTSTKLYALLMASIAAILGWSWWTSRPLAKVSLPDGSELTLFRITPGNEYRYCVDAPPNAGVWKKLWHAFGMEKATMPATADVGFYFRYRGPNGQSGGIPEIVTCDGDARHFSNRCSGPFPWTPSAFPRRRKSFQIRVSTSGPGSNQVTETILDIPNPFAGTKFPTWTADPFPSQTRVGGIPVTIEGWTHLPERDILKSHNKYARRHILDISDALPVPALVMKSSIRPDIDFVCIGQYLSDATGNAALGGLPYSESAWKVDAMIEYGRIAPISPEHLISLGRLTVPEVTGESKLTVPYSLTNHRVESAFLTGSKAFSTAKNQEAAALILNLSRPDEEPSETLKHKRPFSRILEGRCRKLGETEWTLIGVEFPFRPFVPMGSMVMYLPDQFVPGTEFELEVLRSEIVFMSFVVPPPPAPSANQ